MAVKGIDCPHEIQAFCLTGVCRIAVAAMSDWQKGHLTATWSTVLRQKGQWRLLPERNANGNAKGPKNIPKKHQRQPLPPLFDAITAATMPQMIQIGKRVNMRPPSNIASIAGCQFWPASIVRIEGDTAKPECLHLNLPLFRPQPGESTIHWPFTIVRSEELKCEACWHNTV